MTSLSCLVLYFNSLESERKECWKPNLVLQAREGWTLLKSCMFKGCSSLACEGYNLLHQFILKLISGDGSHGTTHHLRVKINVLKPQVCRSGVSCSRKVVKSRVLLSRLSKQIMWA